MSELGAQPSILETLGAALSGADGTTPLIQFPGADWSPAPRPAETSVLLWGRPAQPASSSVPRSVQSALRRELRLQWLRRPTNGPHVRSGVYRLAPRAFGVGGRAGLRRRLLAGAVVAFRAPAAGRRPIEEIAAGLGGEAAFETLTVGAGGALLVRAPMPGGPALLRCGLAGSANDPSGAAAGLRALSGLGIPQVPALLDTGRSRELSWSAESFRPGRRPRELAAGLVQQIAETLANLPRSPVPPPVRRDFALLAEVAPEHAAALDRWARDLDERLQSLPGVFLHGDLWARQRADPTRR